MNPNASRRDINDGIDGATAVHGIASTDGTRRVRCEGHPGPGVTREVSCSDGQGGIVPAVEMEVRGQLSSECGRFQRGERAADPGVLGMRWVEGMKIATLGERHYTLAEQNVSPGNSSTGAKKVNFKGPFIITVSGNA